MDKKIKQDEFADSITSLLSASLEEYTEAMKETIDEVAEGVLSETKSHITWKDKEYSDSFRLTTTLEDKRKRKRLWYVADPHYRLTHLLEFGHHTRKIRKGKEYTGKFPHVRYGLDFAINNYERILKEKIDQCKI